ncbi:MAG: hypothetical protein NZ839_03460 [Endomicrobia bacterium]|nr:hypothetical protein [Endomicrobiia bacterium]
MPGSIIFGQYWYRILYFSFFYIFLTLSFISLNLKLPWLINLVTKFLSRIILPQSFSFRISKSYSFLSRAGGVYLYGGTRMTFLQHGKYRYFAEGAAGVSTLYGGGEVSVHPCFCLLPLSLVRENYFLPAGLLWHRGLPLRGKGVRTSAPYLLAENCFYNLFPRKECVRVLQGVLPLRGRWLYLFVKTHLPRKKIVKFNE